MSRPLINLNKIDPSTITITSTGQVQITDPKVASALKELQGTTDNNFSIDLEIEINGVCNRHC